MRWRYLNGVPYHLTSSFWGLKGLKATHLASNGSLFDSSMPFQHFGYDLDSDGGRVVTVNDQPLHASGVDADLWVGPERMELIPMIPVLQSRWRLEGQTLVYYGLRQPPHLFHRRIWLDTAYRRTSASLDGKRISPNISVRPAFKSCSVEGIVTDRSLLRTLSLLPGGCRLLCTLRRK